MNRVRRTLQGIIEFSDTRRNTEINGLVAKVNEETTKKGRVDLSNIR